MIKCIINIALMSILASPSYQQVKQPKYGWDTWNYRYNGADWISKYPTCKVEPQSPIDLTYGKRSDKYVGRTYFRRNDLSVLNVTNLQKGKSDIRVEWFNNHITKVDIKHTDAKVKSGTFSSILAKELFGSEDKEFKPVSFQFKAGSEHTIDGQRFDGELQIFFEPETKTKANTDFWKVAISVLFSTQLSEEQKDLMKAQSASIDRFFSQLQWQGPSSGIQQFRQKIDDLDIGSMLNQLKVEERWMYKGSMTTPPCERGILWNVLSTVYPIQKSHIDLYVANQLSRSREVRNTDPYSRKRFAKDTFVSLQLETSGNWRLRQQEKDAHKVIYLSAQKLLINALSLLTLSLVSTNL